MSQEIIYTSAPQGLRPGSFGFCTVATTPGMATSVAERLEALSGYRHIYPPGHPRAPLNPVAFSHVILKVGGQRLHVLSRIADAGLDYSQRTNKLAHHVALEAAELVPAGPAWVLAQPGFSETAWAGSPRILPAGRKPPIGELRGGICHSWERQASDAGWAGVLAQNGLEGKRPAYLIFPEGADPLALLVEAQSLLPPSRRWEVSFSTFYSRMPPGIDCQWRCVVAGSPEAQAAVASRGELVIDLTRPLGRAQDNGLATTARTGLSVTPAILSVAAQPPPLRSDLLILDESTPPAPVRPATRRASVPDEDLRPAPPPPPSSRHGHPIAIASVDGQTNASPNRKAPRRQTWVIALLTSALVLSVIGNVVQFLLNDSLSSLVTVVRDWVRSVQAHENTNAAENPPSTQGPGKEQAARNHKDTTEGEGPAATPNPDSTSDAPSSAGPALPTPSPKVPETSVAIAASQNSLPPPPERPTAPAADTPSQIGTIAGSPPSLDGSRPPFPTLTLKEGFELPRPASNLLENDESGPGVLIVEQSMASLPGTFDISLADGDTSQHSLTLVRIQNDSLRWDIQTGDKSTLLARIHSQCENGNLHIRLHPVLTALRSNHEAASRLATSALLVTFDGGNWQMLPLRHCTHAAAPTLTSKFTATLGIDSRMSPIAAKEIEIESVSIPAFGTSTEWAFERTNRTEDQKTFTFASPLCGNIKCKMAVGRAQPQLAAALAVEYVQPPDRRQERTDKKRTLPLTRELLNDLIGNARSLTQARKDVLDATEEQKKAQSAHDNLKPGTDNVYEIKTALERANTRRNATTGEWDRLVSIIGPRFPFLPDHEIRGELIRLHKLIGADDKQVSICFRVSRVIAEDSKEYRIDLCRFEALGAADK